MSTHDRLHLDTEPIRSEVLLTIQGLQKWLEEGFFRLFTIGLDDFLLQHLICDTADRFEKFDLIADQLGPDYKVEVFGLKAI
jgi:hypothetical protein